MQSEHNKVNTIVQRALCIPCNEIHFLGRGATSSAWRVSSGRDDFIIRYIPIGTKRPNTYQSEFTILRLLRQHGCPVPEPISNSIEWRKSGIESVPEPWAITRSVSGAAIGESVMSTAVAFSLGEVLATMDSLPTSKFGRLREQPSKLEGSEGTPTAGILSRWCWAALWPFNNQTLEEHPIVYIRPRLLPMLKQNEPAIYKLGESTDVVLSHADLHGEHIFVHGEHLTGLIDFGAAFIGNRSWDFASLAFYHGWRATQDVIEGYASSSDVGGQCQVNAARSALVLAVYKLDKAVRGNAPKSKVERIVKFIETTLRNKLA